MSDTDAGRGRLAVFGYRLQFSPETQPIRQTVIDNVVLLNLRGSEDERGESVGKLNQIEVGGNERVTLTHDDTRSALARLRVDDLVKAERIQKKDRWSITEKGRTKIADEASAARS